MEWLVTLTCRAGRLGTQACGPRKGSSERAPTIFYQHSGLVEEAADPSKASYYENCDRRIQENTKEGSWSQVTARDQVVEQVTKPERYEIPRHKKDQRRGPTHHFVRRGFSLKNGNEMARYCIGISSKCHRYIFEEVP